MISFEAKAAIWRWLDKQGNVPVTANTLKVTDGFRVIQEEHKLKPSQIILQINNYVKEKQDLQGTAAAPSVASSAAASTTNKRSKKGRTRTPFGARVDLSDCFKRKNLRAQDNIASTDPEVNAIMAKYRITLSDSKAELLKWKNRGGKFGGVSLDGMDEAKVGEKMREKLLVDVKTFATSVLTDVTSGESQAVTSYGVPVSKMLEWRPDIVESVLALMSESLSSSRDKIIAFWALVANQLYGAAIDNFAYSADDVKKKSRRYQDAVRNVREEQGSKWCDMLSKMDNGMDRKDAHPFFSWTFYFMLQQFTYMAKYGGKDEIYAIDVNTNDFSVLTTNANRVLYYLAGWLASAVGKKRVKSELRTAYNAFKAQNTLSKADAASDGLPVSIVDQRSKEKELNYASNDLYQLACCLECVYRKHGNQKGFARYGANLFQIIERVILESGELYMDKFLPCMDGIECSDETMRMIYKLIVQMYTRMRGKYMVIQEKARQKKIGNQIIDQFTTLQRVGISALTAKAKAEGARAATAAAAAAAATSTQSTSCIDNSSAGTTDSGTSSVEPSNNPAAPTITVSDSTANEWGSELFVPEEWGEDVWQTFDEIENSYQEMINDSSQLNS